MTSKECSRCHITKPLDGFPRDKNRVDGYGYWCKECRREHYNRPEISANRKAYHAKKYKEPEYHSRCLNNAKISQAKVMADPVRRERKNARGRIYDRARRQDPAVKEVERLYNKEYNSRPNIMQRRNEHMQMKRKTDPIFKLTENLRRRTRQAITDGYGTKAFKTKELLGCSFEHLKEHIEAQFTEGMSWDLLGKIHLDHIRPVSSFDLTDPEQQKACFHYTNLQPLWAKDNLAKGSSYQH